VSDSTDKKVSGLVIGMRKSGTTWLYENFKNSDLVCVSTKVKESGFFSSTNTLKTSEYNELFPSSFGVRVEVDTALLYDKSAANAIYDYNPEMKILVIRRDMYEYALSRFIHGKRKGLLSEDSLSKALAKNEWFRDELRFEKNIDRYKNCFKPGNICVMDFNELKKSPLEFYSRAFLHLTSNEPDNKPNIEIINPAKISSFPLATRMFSIFARKFRKMGLYSFVSFVKKIGFHRFFEKSPENRKLTEEEMLMITNIISEEISIPTSR